MVQVLYCYVQFVIPMFQLKTSVPHSRGSPVRKHLLVESAREDARLTLIVPSLCPAAGAERSVGQEELRPRVSLQRTLEQLYGLCVPGGRVQSPRPLR